MVGDLNRLRQAIGHFVTFFVEVVGSKDVLLAIGAAEGGVRFRISAGIRRGELPGWQPEAMFERGRGEYGNFASDALGPMIARGLVTLMGGSLELRREDPDRAVLSIWMPLEVVDRCAECVRVEADSVTVQTVLGTLLRQLGCRIWNAGRTGGTVTTVLMEAGFPDETARAARLRSEHPSARLIAVGEPNSRMLFDGVCRQPLTAPALSAHLQGARHLPVGEVV